MLHDFMGSGLVCLQHWDGLIMFLLVCIAMGCQNQNKKGSLHLVLILPSSSVVLLLFCGSLRVPLVDAITSCSARLLLDDIVKIKGLLSTNLVSDVLYL
ncbi:hypothetical protein BD289DRAFT_259069 [Coniella lustricola]|uniref:Uncharacterized protein n=1 Tax=Coniella lustricola TaxID=2025994 RepID=A0A2T3A853_9PEZI|nr:hypothetical protein BD289DRAFT_259069 [Coniella lustricola]